MRIKHAITIGEGESPAGLVVQVREDASVPGLIDADGRALDPQDYPELFAIFGQHYNPKRIRRDDWLARLARRFGVFLTVPNPRYVLGKFKVPDLRGQFVRGL